MHAHATGLTPFSISPAENLITNSAKVSRSVRSHRCYRSRTPHFFNPLAQTSRAIITTSRAILSRSCDSLGRTKAVRYRTTLLTSQNSFNEAVRSPLSAHNRTPLPFQLGNKLGNNFANSIHYLIHIRWLHWFIEFQQSIFFFFFLSSFHLRFNLEKNIYQFPSYRKTRETNGRWNNLIDSLSWMHA